MKKTMANIIAGIWLFVLAFAFTLVLSGCGKGSRQTLKMYADNDKPAQMLGDYHGTTYEVFVRSFYDSNGDGIGDLQGVIKKLDYINDGDPETDTDLGCDAIWLMPVMPSPTYHKYDVTDYCAIDPEYGTIEDYKELTEECHKRGVKVILDTVFNHTSNMHPWFLEAVKYLTSLQKGAEPNAADCPYFDYYNFTKEKTADYYYEVPGTGWYYEGRFTKGMPDLNLYSDAVFSEIEKIIKFWQDLGVDGFRLDAVKEYVSDNTEENVKILNRINNIIFEGNPDAYAVGEAWTAYSSYSRYYASGIPSFFNFAFGEQSGYIAKTLNGRTNSGAESFGIMLEKVDAAIEKNAEDYIDAPFYTNHDTPRSYMNYKGECLQEKVKMAQAMNLFMSGNAFLYYGEELSMRGGAKDEEKRMPMPWDEDGSEGMCLPPANASPQELPYGTLKDQQADELSVYNFVKQAIKIRNANPEIGRGKSTCVSELSDENICTIKKTYREKEVYLVYNLSNETLETDLETINTESGLSLAGSLQTGNEGVTLKKTTLTLPAYSVAILK